MAKVEKFEDLRCWQASRELVKDIYGISNTGPLSKDFEFKNQIRRASISIMSNIAEGFGRFSKKEFTRFLEISLTSANEVKSLLYVASDLTYLSSEEVVLLQKKAEDIKSMNLAFIKYLNTKK